MNNNFFYRFYYNKIISKKNYNDLNEIDKNFIKENILHFHFFFLV